jgi:hypothetical protein
MAAGVTLLNFGGLTGARHFAAASPEAYCAAF